MPKPNRVASIVKGYARQVIKEAKVKQIDPAEFLEHSWLEWGAFGASYEELAKRLPHEAVDFGDIFADAKLDWMDNLVNMVHESLDELVRASMIDAAQEPAFPIGTFLDLSTAHIRKETTDYLTAAANTSMFTDVVVYEKGEYGYLVSTYFLNSEASEIPEELMHLLTIAKQSGCMYLMLDSDGPTVESLPTWDW